MYVSLIEGVEKTFIVEMVYAVMVLLEGELESCNGKTGRSRYA